MEKDFCPTCGASINAHKYNLTKGLVLALVKFFRFANMNQAKLTECEDLSRSEYLNFPRLRHFGLVEKIANAKGKKNVGTWRVTNFGFLWLSGKIAAPSSIKTFRAERIKDHEPESYVDIKDFHEHIADFCNRDDYLSDLRGFSIYGIPKRNRRKKRD